MGRCEDPDEIREAVAEILRIATAENRDGTTPPGGLPQVRTPRPRRPRDPKLRWADVVQARAQRVHTQAGDDKLFDKTLQRALADVLRYMAEGYTTGDIADRTGQTRKWVVNCYRMLQRMGLAVHTGPGAWEVCEGWAEYVRDID